MSMFRRAVATTVASLVFAAAVRERLAALLAQLMSFHCDRITCGFE